FVSLVPSRLSRLISPGGFSSPGGSEGDERNESATRPGGAGAARWIAKSAGKDYKVGQIPEAVTGWARGMQSWPLRRPAFHGSPAFHARRSLLESRALSRETVAGSV